MTANRWQLIEVPGGRLSRRNLLAAGALIAAVHLPAPNAAASIGKASLAESRILGLIRHRESAKQLGAAALSCYPDMCGRSDILARTLGDLGMDLDTLLSSDANEIGNRLSQSIRNDFAIGRTVTLDGWLLSLTEMRLYVLTALAGG